MNHTSSWKRTLLLTVSVAMSLTLATAPMAAAAPASVGQTVKMSTVNVTWIPIQYDFNGVKLAPLADEKGFTYKDSVYVPLRFVSYGLNKAVIWDGVNKTVTINDPTEKEKIQINEFNKNAQSRALKTTVDSKVTYGKLMIQNASVTYYFDGEVKQPKADLPAMIVNNKLYVPLRFIAESVGREVTWDSKTNTVKAIDSSKQENGNQSQGGTTTPEAGGNTGNSTTPGTETGAKLSYESIVNSAERDLNTLELDSQAKLYNLAEKYRAATTTEEKQRLQAEGEKTFSDAQSKFNVIIQDVTAKLKANGYSTEIVQEYQAYFDKQVKLGYKIINEMLGNN